MKIKYNRLLPTSVLEIIKPEEIDNNFVFMMTEVSPKGDSFSRQVSTKFGGFATRIVEVGSQTFDITSVINIADSDNIFFTTDAEGNTVINIAGTVTNIGSSFNPVSGLLTIAVENRDDVVVDLSTLGAQGVTGATYDNGTNLLTITREADVDLVVDLSALQDSLAGLVPETRLISTGTGLTGGGDLTADRTISIANSGVDTLQIAASAVTTAKILNLNVTSDKLAPDSVITSKILDANVTNAKLAATGLDISKFTVGTLDVARLPSTVLLTDTSKTINDSVAITFGATVGESITIQGGGGSSNFPRIQVNTGAVLKVQNGAGNNQLSVTQTNVNLFYAGQLALQTTSGGNVTVSNDLTVTGALTISEPTLAAHAVSVGYLETNAMTDSGTAGTEREMEYIVIIIGTWQMDDNPLTTVTIPGWTAADYAKIRSIDVMIRSDTPGAILYPLEHAGSIDLIDAASGDITLTREASPGIFDSPTFNNPAYNRGWVTIFHEPL